MLIQSLEAVEDEAHAQAHQHTHPHAEDERVDRAHLEQGACHGRSAGDRVIEAHRAEHAAQDGTSHRAHRDGTHGDGERQKAHVKRAHGHAAQADGFHDQLNGDQQCQPGESTKIVILFHKNISSCCRSALDVGYGANLPAKGAGPFFYFTLECFVRERSKGR